MPYQPGEKIEHKYRIERLLGQGAFGEVYLVTHLALGVPRAIKVLRRDAPGMGSGDYQDMEARFRLEAQLGARLNSPIQHPNLLQVYDLRLADDQLLLEMEYASGGDLSRRMQQAYPLHDALRIGQQVAGGLAALHSIDIVHRDLKPANILFDEKGHARLADLGLAQVPHGPSMRSQLSNAMRHPGTAAYMSPEQQNTTDYLSPSSDVYALGLVLFELLTGRVYRNQRPGTSASKLRPDLPAGLYELLARMLAKNPEERPWDGAEVVEMLAGLLGQQSAMVGKPEMLRTSASPAVEPATGGLKISTQVTLHRPEDLPEAARRDWDGTLETLLEQAGSGGLLDWLEQDVLAAAIRERDRPRRDAVNKILEMARKYQQIISTEQDDLRRQELFSELLLKLEGYQPASIGLEPADGLDFGPIDEKTGKLLRTLRVSNLAGDLLVYRLEGTGPAVRVIDPAAGRLLAGESVEVQVELDGKFIQAGPGSGELYLNLLTNQGPRQVSVRYLWAKAILQVVPQVLQFDPRLAGEEQSVEIRNPGTAELQVKMSSELSWLLLVTQREFRLAPGGSLRSLLRIQAGDTPMEGADMPAGVIVRSAVGDVDIHVKCLPDEEKKTRLRFEAEQKRKKAAADQARWEAEDRARLEEQRLKTALEEQDRQQEEERQRIRAEEQRKKADVEKARREVEERVRLDEKRLKAVREEQARQQEEVRRSRELVLDLAPGVMMEFVRVPTGEFTMGGEIYDSEKPVQRVTLPDYLIGRHPVTNRQYQVFVQAGGKTPQHWASGKIPHGKEEHPVVYVSWEDARAFCTWLSQKSGLIVRLPSEVEWEKAARGTDGREYPWGNQMPDSKCCNYNSNVNGTTPIGKYSPQGDSPYGCADMAGNVWDWTADWYQSYSENKVADLEYGQKYKVLRGGSWGSSDSGIHTSYRGRYNPAGLDDFTGFRLCLWGTQVGDSE